MKCHNLDSPNALPMGASEIRRALEAKRDELVRNYLRLEEIAAEREPEVIEGVVALMARNGFLLRQVLDALDRIARDSYGKCLNCGERVCPPGLAALPWATLCQPCEDRMDSQGAGTRSTVFHAV
jgi:RNA polymerase-binding transcription factor DksA